MSEHHQQYNILWSQHASSLRTEISRLQYSSRLTDVSISCSGRADADGDDIGGDGGGDHDDDDDNAQPVIFPCHRLILAASSPQLARFLDSVPPGSSPLIHLRDAAPWEVKAILQFIYEGQVRLPKERLDRLFRLATSLQIRGLSRNQQQQQQNVNDDVQDDEQQQEQKITQQQNPRNIHNNKQKLRQSSTSTSTSTSTKSAAPANNNNKRPSTSSCQSGPPKLVRMQHNNNNGAGNINHNNHKLMMKVKQEQQQQQEEVEEGTPAGKIHCEEEEVCILLNSLTN
jgi:hypothetical protein